MLTQTPALRWALVIATYQRAQILPQCIEAALAQNCPPHEIVVIDASPDWTPSRDCIQALCAAQQPPIPLRYEAARVASLPAQRNQGIALTQCDVVFLIDDDSILHPGCAEAIMAVYAADAEREIVGVQAVNTPLPPATSPTPAISAPIQPPESWLRSRVKRWLKTDQTYFLPYEPHRKPPSLSAKLQQLPIGQIEVMVGYAMTFRRSIFAKEHFCEALMRYAAGEDQDFSYRASRHGALVVAVNARLCHLEISGGRLRPDQVATLAGLNPALFHRLYSQELAKVQPAWRAMLRQRVLIHLLKDLSAGDWRLQKTRGYARALRLLSRLNSQPQDQLVAWYKELQRQIIEDRR